MSTTKITKLQANVYTEDKVQMKQEKKSIRGSRLYIEMKPSKKKLSSNTLEIRKDITSTKNRMLGLKTG